MLHLLPNNSFCLNSSGKVHQPYSSTQVWGTFLMKWCCSSACSPLGISNDTWEFVNQAPEAWEGEEDRKTNLHSRIWLEILKKQTGASKMKRKLDDKLYRQETRKNIDWKKRRARNWRRRDRDHRADSACLCFYFHPQNRHLGGKERKKGRENEGIRQTDMENIWVKK